MVHYVICGYNFIIRVHKLK